MSDVEFSIAPQNSPRENKEMVFSQDEQNLLENASEVAKERERGDLRERNGEIRMKVLMAKWEARRDMILENFADFLTESPNDTDNVDWNIGPFLENLLSKEELQEWNTVGEEVWCIMEGFTRVRHAMAALETRAYRAQMDLMRMGKLITQYNSSGEAKVQKQDLQNVMAPLVLWMKELYDYGVSSVLADANLAGVTSQGEMADEEDPRLYTTHSDPDLKQQPDKADGEDVSLQKKVSLSDTDVSRMPKNCDVDLTVYGQHINQGAIMSEDTETPMDSMNEYCDKQLSAEEPLPSNQPSVVTSDEAILEAIEASQAITAKVRQLHLEPGDDEEETAL